MLEILLFLYPYIKIVLILCGVGMVITYLHIRALWLADIEHDKRRGCVCKHSKWIPLMITLHEYCPVHGEEVRAIIKASRLLRFGTYEPSKPAGNAEGDVIR